jgi:hypothetical protein
MASIQNLEQTAAAVFTRDSHVDSYYGILTFEPSRIP